MTRTVLMIVEDFDSIRNLVSKYALEIDCDVISAATAKDAFILAQDVPPNIIIVDSNMRFSDPASVVSAVRGIAPSAYIIVLDSSSGGGSAEKTGSRGADAVVSRAEMIKGIDIAIAKIAAAANK